MEEISRIYAFMCSIMRLTGSDRRLGGAEEAVRCGSEKRGSTATAKTEEKTEEVKRV